MAREPLPHYRIPWSDRLRFWALPVATAAILLGSVAVLVVTVPAPSHVLSAEVEEALAQEAPAGLNVAPDPHFPLPAGGDAFITSSIRDAQIWFADDSLGPAPVLVTDLLPGAYGVVLRATGGPSMDTTLVIGSDTFVHVHLEAPVMRVRTPRRQPAARPPAVMRDESRVGWSRPGAGATQRAEATRPAETRERARSRVAW